MNKLKYFLFLSLYLVSCNNKDSARISGTFSGLGNKTIYLELISTNSIAIVDSTITDDQGRFKFKIKLKNQLPTFYKVRYKSQEITLLVSPGEKINVRSLGNISNNYLIDGSEDSERIKNLNLMMISARNSMDSLSGLFSVTPEADRDKRMSILSEYSNIYVNQKREMIAFVVQNATSLSSVYALYQNLPNGQSVFGDSNDILYFQLVVDSLSAKYPNSPHVISLEKDLQLMNNTRQISEMIDKATVSDVSYPDIILPDMYGKNITLSSIKGKVIMLDFWSAKDPECKLENAELKEVYKEFADKGFEIYQVSLDESKSLWVNTVQDQKLPWISVCDFYGANCPAARLYNIKTLPTTFLINKDKRIVAKNLSIDALKSKLKELL